MALGVWYNKMINLISDRLLTALLAEIARYVEYKCTQCTGLV